MLVTPKRSDCQQCEYGNHGNVIDACIDYGSKTLESSQSATARRKWLLGTWSRYTRLHQKKLSDPYSVSQILKLFF